MKASEDPLRGPLTEDMKASDEPDGDPILEDTESLETRSDEEDTYVQILLKTLLSEILKTFLLPNPISYCSIPFSNMIHFWSCFII